MSLFQMLVCIFLCVHSNLGDIPDSESVDFSTISLVSRWTSSYAALNRQLLYAANWDSNRLADQLSLNRKEFIDIDCEYQSIYEYQLMVLKAGQNGDESLIDKSEYLEKISLNRDTLEEEYIQMMLKRDHARYVVHKAQRELKDADYIQEVLKLRAGDLDEFNPDGTVNDSHNIQNIDEIPAYGHVTNNDVHSDIACLLDGRLEIDASSDFWMWPVSNGMISAGTWSYPRRKHAFGFRYCCRSIQRA